MKWMREILLSLTGSRKLARSDRPTIKLARSSNSKTWPSCGPAFTVRLMRMASDPPASAVRTIRGGKQLL